MFLKISPVSQENTCAGVYFAERLRTAASAISSALSIVLLWLTQNTGKQRNKEEHGEEVNFLHTNCYFVITNTIGNSKLAHVSKKCPHLYVAEFPKDLASLENSSFYIDHCLLVT